MKIIGKYRDIWGRSGWECGKRQDLSDGKIAQVNVPGLKAQILEGKIDDEKRRKRRLEKMIASEEMDDEPWVELETEFPGEDPYVKGAVMTFYRRCERQTTSARTD